MKTLVNRRGKKVKTRLEKQYFSYNEYENIYSINKVMQQIIPTTGTGPCHFAASNASGLGAMALRM
jgi:hypothetical protein